MENGDIVLHEILQHKLVGSKFLCLNLNNVNHRCGHIQLKRFCALRINGITSIEEKYACYIKVDIHVWKGPNVFSNSDKGNVCSTPLANNASKTKRERERESARARARER